MASLTYAFNYLPAAVVKGDTELKNETLHLWEGGTHTHFMRCHFTFDSWRFRCGFVIDVVTPTRRPEAILIVIVINDIEGPVPI